jgi:hypothetical protein
MAEMMRANIAPGWRVGCGFFARREVRDLDLLLRALAVGRPIRRGIAADAPCRRHPVAFRAARVRAARRRRRAAARSPCDLLCCPAC